MIKLQNSGRLVNECTLDCTSYNGLNHLILQ
jgi:hypothetical protein